MTIFRIHRTQFYIYKQKEKRNKEMQNMIFTSEKLQINFLFQKVQIIPKSFMTACLTVGSDNSRFRTDLVVYVWLFDFWQRLFSKRIFARFHQCCVTRRRVYSQNFRTEMLMIAQSISLSFWGIQSLIHDFIYAVLCNSRSFIRN